MLVKRILSKQMQTYESSNIIDPYIRARLDTTWIYIEMQMQRHKNKRTVYHVNV